MWDVNYDDYKDNTIIQERKRSEIEYNGKKLKITKNYMSEKDGIYSMLKLINFN